MTVFEYIQSRGAHLHQAFGEFEALVGEEREIWLGEDGSALIRSSRGPVTFFTDKARTGWEAAGSPQLEYGPSIQLFAPGCASRPARAAFAEDPEGVDAALVSYVRRLHDVEQLLGEDVVPAEWCAATYRAAAALPSVTTIDRLTDELGRAGCGLAEAGGGQRVELVFASDLSELLGYRNFLTESREFAPAGTVLAWVSFLEREVVTELPPDTPPVPQLPCEHFSGRGFRIGPDFSVMTGYGTDAAEQLAALRDQGVITDTGYASALAYERSRGRDQAE